MGESQLATWICIGGGAIYSHASASQLRVFPIALMRKIPHENGDGLNHLKTYDFSHEFTMLDWVNQHPEIEQQHLWGTPVGLQVLTHSHL